MKMVIDLARIKRSIMGAVRKRQLGFMEHDYLGKRLKP